MIIISFVNLGSACTSGIFESSNLALYMTLETASIAETKKTLVDNTLSYFTDMDCSTIGYMYEGKEYCNPKKKKQYKYKPMKTAYCYQSIANVNCYTEPSNNPNDILTSTYTY